MYIWACGSYIKKKVHLSFNRLAEKLHFGSLHLKSRPFCHFSKIITEGQKKVFSEKSELSGRVLSSSPASDIIWLRTDSLMISPFTLTCENDPEPVPQKQLLTPHLIGTLGATPGHIGYGGPIKPKGEDHLQITAADLMSSNWALSRPRVCLNILSMNITNRCEYKAHPRHLPRTKLMQRCWKRHGVI